MVACRTLLHHDRVDIFRIIVREESDRPRVIKLVVVSGLGGTRLTRSAQIRERIKPHRSTLGHTATHPLTRHLERGRVYREFGTHRRRRGRLDDRGAHQGTTVCDRRDRARHLKRRYLHRILPDRGVVGVTDVPLLIKLLELPIRRGDKP